MIELTVAHLAGTLMTRIVSNIGDEWEKFSDDDKTLVRGVVRDAAELILKRLGGSDSDINREWAHVEAQLISLSVVAHQSVHSALMASLRDMFGPILKLVVSARG